MSVEAVRDLNSVFSQAIQRGDFQNADIPQVIKKLKLLIYTNPNLNRQSSDLIQEACKFAQNNVIYSLKSQNVEEFHRAIKKLDFFYENFTQLQKSDNYYELNSIILIDLLSLNQTKDFYTQLETFQGEELNNKYLQYVIDLNQAIEDGNYRYVFQLRNSSPSPLFSTFLEKIQQTVRNEIARSSQTSYSSLSFAQAVEVFQLTDENEVKEFALKMSHSAHHNSEIRWNIDGNAKKIIFENSSLKKPSINSDDLLRKALRYAAELQKIV